jgi:hypothetical protein
MFGFLKTVFSAFSAFSAELEIDLVEALLAEAEGDLQMIREQQQEVVLLQQQVQEDLLLIKELRKEVLLLQQQVLNQDLYNHN